MSRFGRRDPKYVVITYRSVTEGHVGNILTAGSRSRHNDPQRAGWIHNLTGLPTAPPKRPPQASTIGTVTTVATYHYYHCMYQVKSKTQLYTIKESITEKIKERLVTGISLEAWFRSKASALGICCGQCGTGTGFLWSTWVWPRQLSLHKYTIYSYISL